MLRSDFESQAQPAETSFCFCFFFYHFLVFLAGPLDMWRAGRFSLLVRSLLAPDTDWAASITLPIGQTVSKDEVGSWKRGGVEGRGLDGSTLWGASRPLRLVKPVCPNGTIITSNQAQNTRAQALSVPSHATDQDL